jgi:aryl sulfotransferase
MTERPIAWPKKTRELHNHHMDSTRWNGFPFRDSDIVISTYGKAGTTWMQQIVGQLVFNGDEDVPVHELSPWLDLRIMPREETLARLEAQPHRRFIKTHLPVVALVFSPKARYLYIARDGRDVVWSFHNHHSIANDLWYDALNSTPGLVGPPIDKPNPDIRQYFRDWLEKDGHPFWPFFENVRSWWEIRHLPNVRLVHFAALKRDLAGAIRDIARFLGLAIDEARFPAIIEHCSFSYMKRNAARVAPGGGIAFEGGGEAFLPSGTNGRWRDVLSPEESRRYERMAMEELGLDCAHWLKTGALPS